MNFDTHDQERDKLIAEGVMGNEAQRDPRHGQIQPKRQRNFRAQGKSKDPWNKTFRFKMHLGDSAKEALKRLKAGKK